MGCCVLRIEKGEGEDSFSERMVLPLWRSLHSLNLMLPKEDRRAMLLRLYNEDTPLMDHSKDRFHNSNAQPSADVTETLDDVKDEEADADVNDDTAAVKEEGGEAKVAAAALDGQVETMESGAGDEDVERDDDVLSDAVQAEADDGV